MRNFDTIAIPVAPHVKKFMTAAFDEFYFLSKNDHIGIMILSMLTKSPELDASLKLPKQTEFYHVKVSLNYVAKNGFSIDFEQRKMIGKALDLYFRDIVYSHAIMANKCFGFEIKQSVIDCCDAFGISVDDINPETLCRDIRRKKTADSPNLVSVLDKFKPEKQRMSAV